MAVRDTAHGALEQDGVIGGAQGVGAVRQGDLILARPIFGDGGPGGDALGPGCRRNLVQYVFKILQFRQAIDLGAVLGQATTL